MATHGGKRNRSGPAAKEGSGRSDRRGYTLTALPAEGYRGPIPDFPLPRHVDDYDEKAPEILVLRAERNDARESELWEWAWRTPQACAWSLPSESWRSQVVARWVRQAVLCEGPGAKAADHGQLHRYADQIGMTTAGLAEMGWKVATDELAAKAAARPERTEPKRPRRLAPVADAAQ